MSARAAALLLLVLACGACSPGGGGAPARRATGVRPGDTWVLLTREPAPTGVRERRERWTLLRTLDDRGEFTVTRDAGRARSQWRALVPASAPGRKRRPESGPRLETVRVPAGTFRCRRTQRTYTEREGRVMRVDEWWAAEAPVPVQAWTRWVAHANDALRDPPRRPADQHLGTAWTVLERRPAR